MSGNRTVHVSISEKLRKEIEKSGLSYNQLSQKSGVPQPVISRFMGGLLIRINTADKLAKYFGLELRKRK